jgi:hypothetical protein
MSAMTLTLLLLQQGELAAIRRASLRDGRHLPMWLILKIDVGNRLPVASFTMKGSVPSSID